MQGCPGWLPGTSPAPHSLVILQTRDRRPPKSTSLTAHHSFDFNRRYCRLAGRPSSTARAVSSLRKMPPVHDQFLLSKLKTQTQTSGYSILIEISSNVLLHDQLPVRPHDCFILHRPPGPAGAISFHRLFTPLSLRGLCDSTPRDQDSRNGIRR